MALRRQRLCNGELTYSKVESLFLSLAEPSLWHSFYSANFGTMSQTRETADQMLGDYFSLLLTPTLPTWQYHLL